MSFLDLMPTINPNIEEIVIDGENVPLVTETGSPKSKPTHSQVFNGKRKTHSNKPKRTTEQLRESENIVMSVEEPQKERPTTPEKAEEKTPEHSGVTKKKYPHLVKARAKALEKRQEKAKLKAQEKEIAKQAKIADKQARRDLRVAKNRERARENYHKKKDLKKTSKKVSEEKLEKIEEEEFIEKAQKHSVVNGEFNYEKFAKFMFKYETDKKHYQQSKVEKTKPKEEKTPVKPAEPKKPKRATNKSRNINIPPKNNNRNHPQNYLSFYRETKSVNSLFEY